MNPPFGGLVIHLVIFQWLGDLDFWVRGAIAGEIAVVEGFARLVRIREKC